MQNRSKTAERFDYEGRLVPDSTAVRLAVRSVLLLVYGCHYWYRVRVLNDCPNRETAYGGFGGKWKFLTAINEVIFFPVL